MKASFALTLLQQRKRHSGDRLLLLLIVFILSSGIAKSQTKWDWARQAGSNANAEAGRGVVTDSLGNAYVTGSVRDPSFSLPGFGVSDVFLAKYDLSGTLLWVTKCGGSGSDGGGGIAIDDSGSIYIAGSFAGIAAFKSASPSPVSQQITSSGNSDSFIAKYDPSGVLQWVTKVGSPNISNEGGGSIAVDQAGGVYITGGLGSATGYFYNQPGNANALASSIFLSSNTGIFLAKYTNTGTFVWAKGVSGDVHNSVNGIAVNSAGTRVVVTGGFQGQVNFGNSVTLTSAGGSREDMFVAAYDGAGVAHWAQQGGGSSTDVGQGVAIDSADSVYVTGGFASSVATFYSNPASPSDDVSSPFTVTNHFGVDSPFDIFLAKYDNSGVKQWVASAGGAGTDFAFGVTLDGPDVLITGFVETNVLFGTTSITGTPGGDVFVARYNRTSGTANSAVSGGGLGVETGLAVAPVALGVVYVTGAFQSNLARFGVNTITNVGGSEDVFVAKLTMDVVTSTTPGLERIIITKRSVGGNGTFNFTGNLGAFQITTSGGTGTRVSGAGVGLHTVTESPLPPGWQLTSLVCSETQTKNTNTNGPTALIALDPGEFVTCTFTNTTCPAITLTPAASALPQPTINTPYSQVFTATGGCGTSFTYSLTSGALPNGFTLSTDGVLSGTATQLAGSDFTVTATDSCGCSQSQAYSLTTYVLRTNFPFTRGMEEFCIWGGGGGAYNSPTPIDNRYAGAPFANTGGNTSGVRFGSIGLCYGRILSANNNFAFKYTFNAIPVAVLSYPDVNRDLGIPLPGSETRRNVFGAGLSPIGFQLYFRPQNRIKPFVNTSGGFIFFNDPVPQLNGARFNLTYDFGGGVQVFRDSRRAFTFGYKYQRLSNGGRALNNPGFDGHVFSLGYSIFKAPKIVE